MDLDRLLKYGLSADDVYEAIRNNNQNVGGGFLDRHSEQFLIRGIGLIRSVEDISKIVLKSSAGVPVIIADVAEVRMDHAVRQGAAVKDGKRECVGGVVMLLRGENSRDVVARVEAKVAEINDSNIMPARRPDRTLLQALRHHRQEHRYRDGGPGRREHSRHHRPLPFPAERPRGVRRHPGPAALRPAHVHGHEEPPG